MVKAIFFDLFETLVTEANGVKITSSIIAERLKIPRYEYKKLASELRDCRYRGKYPEFRDVLIYIMNSLGTQYDIKMINEISMEREACKAQCFKNISEEIIDMLKALKSRKLKLVLISNASNEEIKGFYDSKIKSYFDDIIFSCETGYIKPEPEIYKHACNRLGLEPVECLFVGDGGSNELKGAENVGIKAFCAYWFISKFGQTPLQDFPVLNTPTDLLTAIDS